MHWALWESGREDVFVDTVSCRVWCIGRGVCVFVDSVSCRVWCIGGVCMGGCVCMYVCMCVCVYV